MTIASQPASFSSGPQKPPASDSPNPPVSGERATAEKRVAVEKGAPVSSPLARIRMLPGPRGSTPGASSFSRMAAASALPPG